MCQSCLIDSRFVLILSNFFLDKLTHTYRCNISINLSRALQYFEISAGMFNESVEPLLDSITSFASLQKKDEKGIASCLGLLTKCLGKFSLEEFEKVRQKFPENFKKEHPFLESYVQGIEAVRHIESLHESLYSSRHMVY